MALAFQRGEERGFAYFFDLLRPRLQYYAFRILKDEDDAADAAEDGFIKIWADHKTFNHPKVIKSWLYTTVRNACFEILNKRKRTSVIQTELCVLTSHDIEDSIENQVIRAEVIGEVYESFKYLPDDCRSIISMLFKEGLTLDDIAQKLGIEKRTVKAQRWIGLKMIKGVILEGKIPAGFLIRKTQEENRKNAELLKQEKKKQKEDLIRRVITLRKRGCIYAKIAEEVGISVRRCQQLYLKHATAYNLP